LNLFEDAILLRDRQWALSWRNMIALNKELISWGAPGRNAYLRALDTQIAEI
jgi:hypothetical protein